MERDLNTAGPILGFDGTTLKEEGRFSFADPGTFTVTECAARKGRNPATGEAIKIQASKSVRFKPVPALKTLVAKVKVSKGERCREDLSTFMQRTIYMTLAKLREKTGVQTHYLEQLQGFGNKHRDPRG